MSKILRRGFITLLIAFYICGLAPIAAAKIQNLITVYMYEMKHWDPHIATGDEARVLHNIYETLVIYDDGKLKPKLATSWKQTNDGREWTFTLRKGVKFHNGESFNAVAAKYSLDRVRKMGDGPSWMFEPINEVKVVDEFTIKMICKDPTAVDLIMSSYYGAYMMPPRLTEEKGSDWFQAGNAVGTGPYMLVSYEKDVQTVLKKFDDYWGGWESNQFDLAIYKPVEEAVTAIQLLKRGEMDMIEKVPVNSVPALLSNPDIVAVYSDSVVNEFYNFHMQKPPTDDINVRRAICHAVDLDGLVDNLVGKSGIKGTAPLPVGMFGHNPDLKPFEYNLEKAKQLMAKSKYAEQWRKGELEITVSQWSGITKSYAVYIQSALKKLGIKVVVDTTLWPASEDMFKDKKRCPQMTIQSWWADYATPSGWLKGIWFEDEKLGWNWAYYANPAYEKLINEAMYLEAVDLDKAVSKYKQAQQMLWDDVVMMPLADRRHTVFMRKHIKGFRHLPIYNGAYWIYNLHK